MKYHIEIMRTSNKKTQKERYFIIACGAPERISKKDYDKIRDKADGIANLFTESNETVFRHYTTTVHYE